ncbi:hypothetical protein Bbelb_140060 [Branchiostoma belcheri]|nr:hypothetical protein Bbelb_140060 [Branchiostoma belcheri]
MVGKLVIIVIWLSLGHSAVTSDELTTCPAGHGSAPCADPVVTRRACEFGRDANITVSVTCTCGEAVRSCCYSPSGRVLLTAEVVKNALGQQPSQQVHLLYFTIGNIADIARGSFANMPRLRSLKVWSNCLNCVKKEWFQTLGSLQNLDLSSNQIRVIQEAAFEGLKQLKHLFLSSNKLHTVDSAWWQGMYGLEVLEISKLSATDFLASFNKTDKTSPVFSGLKNIRILQLRFSELRIIRKLYFAGLVTLKHLWLNKNKLAMIEAGAFAGLKISYLSLEGNVFTAVRCGWFSGMQTLMTIDLSENLVSSVEPCAFHGAPKLRRIQLTRNRLSFVASEWFEGLRRLRILDLSHNYIVGLQDLNVPQVRLANNPLRCSCTTAWLKGSLGETRQIVDRNEVTCDYPPGLRGVVVANVSSGPYSCPNPVVLIGPVYNVTELQVIKSSDNNGTEPSGTEVPLLSSTADNHDNVTETSGMSTSVLASTIDDNNATKQSKTGAPPVSLSTPGDNFNISEPGSTYTSATPSGIGDNNATEPSGMGASVPLFTPGDNYNVTEPGGMDTPTTPPGIGDNSISVSPSATGDNNATESKGTGVQVPLGDMTKLKEDGRKRRAVASPAIFGSEGENLNITCLVYWEQRPDIITWTLPNGARLASEEGTTDYPDLAGKIQMTVEHKINAEGWPCRERGRPEGDCVNFFGKSVVQLVTRGGNLGLSGQHSCTAETETGKGTASISVEVTKVISTSRKEGKETRPSATETISKPEFHTTESRAETTETSIRVSPSGADLELADSGLVSPLVIVVPASVCCGVALLVICSIIGSKLSERLRH